MIMAMFVVHGKVQDVYYKVLMYKRHELVLTSRSRKYHIRTSFDKTDLVVLRVLPFDVM